MRVSVLVPLLVPAVPPPHPLPVLVLPLPLPAPLTQLRFPTPLPPHPLPDHPPALIPPPNPPPQYRVFSLDTGRLNPETYQLFDAVEKHYNIRIEARLFASNLLFPAVCALLPR